MTSSSLKRYKVWYKFKSEAGDQLTFDFYNENISEWTGPFHFFGEEDSETMIEILYNEYDSRNNLIYKITGEFNGS